MISRRHSRTMLAIAVICVLAIGTLAAHHGWNEYDSGKPVTLTGTVTKYGYENPHAFVDLDVNGKAWRAILAPPSRMKARGVLPDQLKAGATVTVMGYPHKTRAIEMRTEDIKIGDKTTNLR